MTINAIFLKLYNYMLYCVTVKGNIMHGFLEKHMEIKQWSVRTHPLKSLRPSVC
jgi:hypothetical protein